MLSSHHCPGCPWPSAPWAPSCISVRPLSGSSYFQRGLLEEKHPLRFPGTKQTLVAGFQGPPMRRYFWKDAFLPGSLPQNSAPTPIIPARPPPLPPPSPQALQARCSSRPCLSFQRRWERAVAGQALLSTALLRRARRLWEDWFLNERLRGFQAQFFAAEQAAGSLVAQTPPGSLFALLLRRAGPMVAGTVRAAAGEDRGRDRRLPWADAARAPGPQGPTAGSGFRLSSELRVPRSLVSANLWIPEMTFFFLKNPSPYMSFNICKLINDYIHLVSVSCFPIVYFTYR